MKSCIILIYHLNVNNIYYHNIQKKGCDETPKRIQWNGQRSGSRSAETERNC